MFRLSTKWYLRIKLGLISKSKKLLKAIIRMILKFKILTKD